MGRGSRRSADRGASLVAVVGRVAVASLIVVVSLSSSSLLERFTSFAAANAEAVEPENCQGDEGITFAPSEPAADEQLLLSVTSSRKHRGVWLSGGDGPTAIRDYEGRMGWVWDWTLTPKFAGPLLVRFFVDSTLLCA